jgi:hypothetical protein
MNDTAIEAGLVPEMRSAHVLTPVSDAECVVQQEYEEVKAERRAFEAFRERVVAIDSVSTAPTAPHQRTIAVKQPSERHKHVHRAYQETVMSVAHYDDVYAEPFVEHFAAELSPELAAPLQHEETAPFNAVYKSRLTAAIERAIDDRREFCAILKNEQESLEASRKAIRDLLENLGRTTVPSWYRNDFESQLEEVAETRQETVHTRRGGFRADGHGLCAYLYQNQVWTYPVLTAVARFRSVAG